MKRFIRSACLALATVFAFMGINSMIYKVRAVIVIPCDYWYSNEDEVAFWQNDPTVYYEAVHSSGAFSLSACISHAINQWDLAGIDVTLTSVESTADIRIYSGDAFSLYMETGFLMENGSAGETYITSMTYFAKTDSGSGSLKTVYKMNSGVVVLISDFGNDQNNSEYKNVCTHELGHSLGWLGHSLDDDDVMYPYVSEIYDLTSRDKLHLNQWY